MKLFQFLSEKMRMSHVYQPALIKHLLQNDGTASSESIARSLLSYDYSQLEYYEAILHKMVGRVLRNHNIISRTVDGYELVDFKELSNSELEEIILLCDKKINDFISSRGREPWEHRTRRRRAVRGSIRYKVLARAKSRCECCGISNDEKVLEVDHIVPLNLGGANSINNYQALCYSCNAQKRDGASTNFSEVKAMYDLRLDDCLFCTKQNDVSIMENNLAYAIFDGFPVTPHHTLVIPKRHFPNFFEISQAELNAVYELLSSLKVFLFKKDPTISAFNIGINAGFDAGQTVMHCHFHLIPRRNGDVPNPRGGVRHLIPGKGFY